MKHNPNKIEWSYILFYIGEVEAYWKIYMAQNSLELKLSSKSSPPFYAKQRTLSPEEKNGLISPSSQPVQPLADFLIYLLFPWVSAAAH